MFFGPKIITENLVFAVDPASHAVTYMNDIVNNTAVTTAGSPGTSTDGVKTVTFDANGEQYHYGTTNATRGLDDITIMGWVQQGSTSNPTYSTSGGHATGKFVRIGNLVYIQWSMHITGVSGQGGGNAQLMGLPYPAVCQTYEGHIGVMYNDVFSNETQKGYIPNGSDYLQLVPIGRTQTNLGIGTLSTGYFGGGGHYLVG